MWPAAVSSDQLCYVSPNLASPPLLPCDPTLTSQTKPLSSCLHLALIAAQMLSLLLKSKAGYLAHSRSISGPCVDQRGFWVVSGRGAMVQPAELQCGFMVC